jgi:hypothetical protein
MGWLAVVSMLTVSHSVGTTIGEKLVESLQLLLVEPVQVMFNEKELCEMDIISMMDRYIFFMMMFLIVMIG